MRLRVDPSRPLPPSAQLVEGILDALARGQLAAGDQLPTVRGLAEEVVVNPNTVARAYRDLEALGVVEGRHGSGVYVGEEGPVIARRERRGATLLECQRAVQAAVAVGHEPGELRAAFDKALAQAARTAGSARRGGRS